MTHFSQQQQTHTQQKLYTLEMQKYKPEDIIVPKKDKKLGDSDTPRCAGSLHAALNRNEQLLIHL